jgi:hypothetical protein
MTSPVFSISLPAAAALFIDFLDAEGIENGSARRTVHRAACAARAVDATMPKAAAGGRSNAERRSMKSCEVLERVECYTKARLRFEKPITEVGKRAAERHFADRL